jgi:putative membrane protein
MKKIVPIVLLVIYVSVFAVCAVSPYDRGVWLVENIPMVMLVAGNLVVYRYFRFSTLAFILMSFLIILHTIGGHYTFERVPFGFVTNLFGFTRNHYDRISHFTVGFYAYPIAEILLVKKLVRSKWILAMFPIFAIFTVAAGYEIFEWIYALCAEASAGAAVLGSQGDVWDAQKDMLADGLGALLAMALFWIVNHKEIRQIRQIG